MSTQSALPLSPLLTPQASSRATSQFRIEGLSFTGVLLFLIGLLVAGSGFTSFRPQMMGVSLHPYLIPMAAALPLVFMARLAEFPVRVLFALVVFTAMYIFSVFNGSVAVGEVFKIGAATITIITCALLVRRRGDFVAGALGLSLAVALLAARGLQEESTNLGVDAIQGANKNSYSLFSLPALLMAGFIYLTMPKTPFAVRAALILCTLPTLAATFMSGNRSGYLGAVLIGGMLFWNRRGRGMLLVGAIAAAVAFWIMQFGSTHVLDEKLKQTVEGNDSDNYRVIIFMTAIQIGFENPIVGVSPQQLPFEIGRRTSVLHSHGYIDPHNVYAHVIGGSGLICFAAFVAVFVTLWTWKPRDGHKIGKDEPLYYARSMLRMLLVVWAVRGVFSREVLYAPSFNIALGMSIGLCMVAEKASRPASKRRPTAAGLSSTASLSPPPQAALPSPTT